MFQKSVHFNDNAQKKPAAGNTRLQPEKSNYVN
jgi:hypothetical protein